MRDERRLIEAAAPQPSTMKRHGHQHAVALIADQRRHVARHRPRDRDLSSVFQADCEASRQLVIGDRRSCPLDPRRPSQANAASRLLGCRERETAGRASGFPKELDLLPAVRAKAVNFRHDRPASGAAGRKRKIQCPTSGDAKNGGHDFLSLGQGQRTSAAVPGNHPPELFDTKALALRKERAARIGPELFLYERAIEDCLERVLLMRRSFGHALLIAGSVPDWPERLGTLANRVDVMDDWEAIEEIRYDLVVAVGTLDTANDLPLQLRLIRNAMTDDALFIGAVAGGDTLPQLRNAMRAADAVTGAAAPHVHPRIDASSMAPLLVQAGFADPVVDIDRAAVSYPSFDRLVADLRAMAGTNILSDRPRFVGRAARAAASAAFSASGDGTRTLETFEILHFAAWTPKKP